MVALLQVQDIGKNFGGLQALASVSFIVEQGEVLGLIGPNGSGKSTMFNVVTGTFPPSAGRVIFNGEDITGLPAHEVAKRGIGRTFQSVRPFMHLSVMDNVLVAGMYGIRDQNKVKPRDKAQQVLEMVNLADKAHLPAHQLNVMQRKWLEIARTLATEPTLLLLDEFMVGLNPSEVQEAVEFIKHLKDINITVIVVEHIMKAIMNCSERIVVLNAGMKIADGAPQTVIKDPMVVSAYLGREYAHA